MAKQYAFWEYDHYPFVLSGEVVGRPDAEGRVEVNGYGGLRFKTLRVIDGDEGRRMSDALNHLRELHREALAEVARDFRGRALLVAPWLRNCKRSSFYDKG